MKERFLYIISIINFIILLIVVILWWQFISYQKSVNSELANQWPTNIQIIQSSGSIVDDSNVSNEAENNDTVDLLEFLENEEWLQGGVTWTGSQDEESITLPDAFTISYGWISANFSLEEPIDWYDEDSWVSAIFNIEILWDKLINLESSVVSQGNQELEDASQQFQNIISNIKGKTITEIITFDEENILFIELRDILIEYIAENK